MANWRPWPPITLSLTDENISLVIIFEPHAGGSIERETAMLKGVKEGQEQLPRFHSINFPRAPRNTGELDLQAICCCLVPLNTSRKDVKYRLNEFLGQRAEDLELVSIVEGDADPVARWRGWILLAKHERIWETAQYLSLRFIVCHLFTSVVLLHGDICGGLKHPAHVIQALENTEH